MTTQLYTFPCAVYSNSGKHYSEQSFLDVLSKERVKTWYVAIELDTNAIDPNKLEVSRIYETSCDTEVTVTLGGRKYKLVSDEESLDNYTESYRNEHDWIVANYSIGETPQEAVENF